MIGNEAKYKEILNSPAKKICVIAGPGSGKTKGVIIPKAKQIIGNESINIEEILILSFSRLSAQDLREKIKNLIGCRALLRSIHSVFHF